MSGRRWVAPPERGLDRGAPRASPRRPRGSGGSAGIPALDGVRALAVALVLADHGGIPGVSGGFIGVDVFFVLSGFLITSLLLDELGRTGAIDLPGFWVRRARRLLPALIVMVLAVVVLRELFPSDAVATVARRRRRHVLLGRQLDLRRSATPTTSRRATPRRRCSTPGRSAVEEQYYVVWPLVLVAVAVVLALVDQAQARPAVAAHGPHGSCAGSRPQERRARRSRRACW